MESLQELPFSEPVIYTVSELTANIKDLLESTFDYVWVVGEVSNLRIPFSGHAYFSLKDDKSQMRAVAFKYLLNEIKFELKNGLLFICHGRLSVYEPRGEYQVIVDYFEPKGVGALQLAFEQLKERLAKEGLFDQSHKKPIPVLPKRIGIVTSPTGAAIRDILNILERRFPNIEILIYPAKVQGEGAAKEIVEGISSLNELGNLDVIIIGRGGGSLEDLFAFNEEIVARAIFNSTIPIISAVGHEIDYTISDFVSDLRAPTPSAAAELVVKRKDELKESVRNCAHRLEKAIRQHIIAYKGQISVLEKGLGDPKKVLDAFKLRTDDYYEKIERSIKGVLTANSLKLEGLYRELVLKSPKIRLEKLSMKTEQLEGKLFQTICNFISQSKQRLEFFANKLDTLSPLNVLTRGYSITLKTDTNETIQDSSQLSIHDSITTVLKIGRVKSTVDELH